jgi:hypothetical protein
MVEKAGLAARWRIAARMVPAAAAALGRAADRKSEAATALLMQNLDAQDRITLILGAFTSRGAGGARAGGAKGSARPAVAD